MGCFVRAVQRPSDDRRNSVPDVAEDSDNLRTRGDLAAEILAALPTGVLTTTPDGTIVEANPACFALLRRSPDDPLVGENVESVLGPLELLTRGVRKARPLPKRPLSAPVQMPSDAPAVELEFSASRFVANQRRYFVIVFQEAVDSERAESVAPRSQPRHSEVNEIAPNELSPPVSPSRAISPFEVADYVQLAGLSRRSVVIEVALASGLGRIVIRSGHLVAAFDAEGEGVEAFRRLALATQVPVACRPVAASEDQVNIDETCEAMLLEVARELDERGRNSLSPSAAFAEGDVRSAFPAAVASRKDSSELRAVHDSTQFRAVLAPLPIAFVGSSTAKGGVDDGPELTVANEFVSLEELLEFEEIAKAFSSDSMTVSRPPPTPSAVETVPVQATAQGAVTMPAAVDPLSPAPSAGQPSRSPLHREAQTIGGIALAHENDEHPDSEAQRHFDSLVDRGVSALVAKDYETAYATFRAASAYRDD